MQANNSRVVLLFKVWKTASGPAERWRSYGLILPSSRQRNEKQTRFLRYLSPQPGILRLWLTVVERRWNATPLEFGTTFMSLPNATRKFLFNGRKFFYVGWSKFPGVKVNQLATAKALLVPFWILSSISKVLLFRASSGPPIAPNFAYISSSQP